MMAFELYGKAIAELNAAVSKELESGNSVQERILVSGGKHHLTSCLLELEADNSVDNILLAVLLLCVMRCSSLVPVRKPSLTDGNNRLTTSLIPVGSFHISMQRLFYCDSACIPFHRILNCKRFSQKYSATFSLYRPFHMDQI